MKFLKTSAGLVNIDYVIRIEPPKDGARWVHYLFGKTVEVAKLLQQVPPTLLVEPTDELSEEITDARGRRA